jgi:adenylosuccinate synthase
MKFLFVLSGPVGVGKSAFCREFESRLGAARLSTRTILTERGFPDDRGALQAAGEQLDKDTDGKWVADSAAAYVQNLPEDGILLVDSARIAKQIEYLRHAYGQKVCHVHLTASIEILRQRYLKRDRKLREFDTYDELKQNKTEANIEQLGAIADVRIVTDRLDPKSVLALAVAGRGLYPTEPERLVDVIVGAQYGSEGKGNICSYLASDYDVLVRVGGPNAGHWASIPEPIKYIQLPSGTAANPTAKILIGAGATISIPTILQEITERGLTPDRLSIDPNAMIIENSDIDFENQNLEVIGSTKKGVGAATARKILRGDQTPHLGSVVRLARNSDELKPFIRSVGIELENAYANGQRIMLEGTQGTDLSLHHATYSVADPTYPHVTSRDTTASGCLADAGISPLRVRRVVMVTRTYPIRVGGTSGPMGREIDFETVSARSGLPVEEIAGTEVGTVSGKTRRIAELDWEQVRRSAVINGATDIALTFADYLSSRNQSARRFEQLTAETQAFIAEIERVTNAPVSLISTRFVKDDTADRRGIIDRRSWR